jgi:CRISPR-associated protein Csb2
MLRLEANFLTGRYHATPWGRHVNEGVVEWPPSPWRVLRALLAAGFTKLAWREPPPDARRLFEQLAASPPTYWLPPASAAHTRHYMPANEGRKVRSDKILDAFADVGRTSELGIVWDVALDDASLALVEQLAGGVAYLGRAESWAELRRVDETRERGRMRCAVSDVPVIGHERIPLLAPTDADSYAAWRDGELGRARDVSREKARLAAAAKGKKAPTKLSAKDEARLEAPYPTTLVDALQVETGDLRSFGWSQPPGSRWLSYWRPTEALSARSPVGSARSTRESPTLALLALASDTRHGNRLPSFSDALLRLESLHDALVKRSDTGHGSSWCFTGAPRDGRSARDAGHRHAELLPLALDAGGGRDASGREERRIDHVLVHCKGGFDADALHALRTVTSSYTKNHTYFVTLVGLAGDLHAGDEARRAELAELAKTVPVVAASARWVSSTPFVPPRHLKRRGRNDLAGQVRAELASRGFEDLDDVQIEVEVLNDARQPTWVDAAGLPTPSPRYRTHRRERLDPQRQPPQRVGYHLRLTFREAVRGPLALGYASHFGLGLFEPA